MVGSHVGAGAGAGAGMVHVGVGVGAAVGAAVRTRVPLPTVLQPSGIKYLIRKTTMHNQKPDGNSWPIQLTPTMHRTDHCSLVALQAWLTATLTCWTA